MKNVVSTTTRDPLIVKKNASVKTILTAGLACLRRDGWVQGHIEKWRDGKIIGRCSSGALLHVSAPPSLRRQMAAHYQDAKDLLHDEAVNVGEGITDWNDAPGRTFRQIVAGWKKAIRVAK